MDPNRSKAIKVIIDICALLGAFAVYVSTSISIEPFERGFWCSDQTIRYPYRDSIISIEVLVASCLIIGSGLIGLVEFTIALYQKRDFLQRFLIALYRQLLPLIYGSILVLLVANIAKITSGRMRPHFWAICNPDINCANPVFRTTYVQSYRCRNENFEDSTIFKQSKMSFFSSFATLSTFCAFYLINYLQRRFSWPPISAVKLFIQVMLASASIFICLSRVSDNHNHWSDAAVGFVFGFVAGIGLSTYHVKPFLSCDDGEEFDHKPENLQLNKKPSKSSSTSSHSRLTDATLVLPTRNNQNKRSCKCHPVANDGYP